MRPDLASEHLQRATDAIDGTDMRHLHFTVAHFAARLQGALGQAQGGLDVLARFEVSQRLGVPSVFERAGVACMRARLLATLGDLAGARAALDEVQGGPWPVIGTTDAQLHLAAGDPATAVGLLEACEHPSDAHTVTVLETSVLLAIAHDEAGAPADAGRALEQALEDADRTGVRWPFVEGGRQMESLLQRQIRNGTAHRAVVGEVLAAFDDRLPGAAPGRADARAAQPPRGGDPPLPAHDALQPRDRVRAVRHHEHGEDAPALDLPQARRRLPPRRRRPRARPTPPEPRAFGASANPASPSGSGNQ